MEPQLELFIWVGPVHSGKSTHALIRANRYLRLGHDVVLVRPLRSIRPDPAKPHSGDRPGFLVTKTGHRFPALETDDVRDIDAAAVGSTVLWLDEPFMFDHPELLFEIVQRQRRERIILISTLGATNTLECISEGVSSLLGVADHRIDCKADCDYCGSLGTATRSVYVGDAPKTDKVKVGGESAYKAACPTCWNRSSALTPL